MEIKENFLDERDTDDHLNFGSYKLSPITEAEKAKAEKIIANGWNIAKNSPHCSPEEIWADFDEIRARIAAESDRKSA
ncbi:hypothetical protein [Iningainema tapete]|uniref:Uncharacterized protein n=1 Tax=Iningainema tapete BLCC-T55 TaxID=2748662 RepID=A0A8J7C635_9CYAN|nr:hypothetical protein [Iningainema tapete]MBD2773819.1 hypothetical protein [Iningainema tapete BLCC-T55]